MRLIIDTNVFVSGIFFSGPPYQIMDAWRHGEVSLIVSPDILEEYQRVGDELANRYRGMELKPWIELLVIKATLVDAPPLADNVCVDHDDDKFLACALASKTKIISSADKHLLDVSGYHGIRILKPRAFVDQYLKKR
ncbi:MAG: putative toxin-antitoxin system toxin component, PIN family [Verrucomicrobiae bacterium]|nr:putative toxin-antitoxin system toxin component, PIN family [Verrucomicrobiae bacterium]